MFEIGLFLFGIMILALIYFRRWYLHEKISAFGKMVLKRGLKLPGKITKDDIEVTVDEMIPDEKDINPKLQAKGEIFYKKAEQAQKNNNNNKEAVKCFIQCLAMNPSRLDAHYKLANIYLAEGSYGKSELFFRKLVQKDHSNLNYLKGLADSLFLQEKFTEAKSFFEKAVEASPKESMFWVHLAECNRSLDEKELAYKNLQHSLELEGQHLPYLILLSLWYFEDGKKEEALGVLMAAKEKWPEDKDLIRIMTKIEQGQ